MKIENRTELKEYRIECQKKQSADCRVLVCGGTGCLASGSGKIYEKLKELTKDHTGVEVKIGEEIAHTKVMKSGCHGFCEMGPLVRIEPYNYLYIKVKLEDCEEIYNETILGGRPVERLLYKTDRFTRVRNPFRSMLDRCVWYLRTADISTQSILGVHLQSVLMPESKRHSLR